MKPITLLFLLLLTLPSLFAQDLPAFEGRIKWSENISCKHFYFQTEIIGVLGNVLYLTRIVEKKRVIEKYSLSSLKMINSVVLDLQYDKKHKFTYKKFFMFGGRPVLLSSFYNKKMKLTHTFVQSVDPRTLEFSERTMINKTKTPNVVMIGTIERGALLFRLKYGLFSGELTTSEDQGFGYIEENFHEDHPNMDDYIKLKNTIGILYDSEFNLLTKNRIKLPYDNFLTLNKQLSNNATLFIAGHQIFSGTISMDQLSQSIDSLDIGNLEIIVLDVESGETKELMIDIGDKKIETFTMNIDNEDGIIVSGIYNNEDGGISGSFFMQYDSNLKNINSNIVAFEDDFTEEFLVTERKTIYYDHEVKSFFHKPNGTYTLLVQPYYYKKIFNYHAMDNAFQEVIVHLDTNLIVLNFDENGVLEWKKNIKKKERMANDGSDSFFATLNGNDVNIIYDAIIPKTTNTEGMTKNEINHLRDTHYTARVVLDENGEITKEKLFDHGTEYLELIPKYCGKVYDGFIYLYTVGGKIGTIEL